MTEASLPPERWDKVRELFASAQELDGPARAAFVEQCCAGDAALEAEVERLLALSDRATGFLEDPVVHRAVPSVADPVLSLGDIVAGRFTVVGLLGRGGMGEVYEANDAVLGERVALKVLRSRTYDADALARFRREVQLARRITHPGVCRVHDVAFHRSSDGDDAIVLTMELIRGETLAARLRRGPLPADIALDFARQIGDALDAAHAERVLHRDIKPGNILLEARLFGGERAVLTDFGIARAMDPGIHDGSTRRGTLVGTPEYMAPEVLRGAAPSIGSDLYSYAVVVYEMMTGARPGSAGSEDDRLDSTWRSGLTRALDSDPHRRFDSCRELLDVVSSDRATAARRRSRGSIAIAAGSLAAIGVMMTGMRLPTRFSPRRSPPLTERDTIVIADFVNTTGDPVFDDTLKQGLSVQLLQSPFLNVVPERKLDETLGLMGRAPGEILTPQLARDACIRTNSKAIVIGSIARLGAQYVLGLRAQACASGADLAHEQLEAARKEDVLKTLDRAAARVRSALGESLGSIQRYDAPLEQATTSSLKALQVYSLGLKAFREKGDAAAIAFHSRAVELDPQFAMAYVALGSLYANLGQDGLARENFEKAYALRDRATERERYRITADYFTFGSGELEKGTLVYEQWAQAYPRDWNPLARLVLNRLSSGQYEQAIIDGRAAIRLYPEGISTPVNLMLANLALNRVSDARALYDQTAARLPNHSRLHIIRYAIAFFEGDSAEMARQAERTIGTPGDEDMQLSFQSDTAAYFGRLAQARDLSQQAAAVAERHDQTQTAAAWLLNAALREAEVGNVSRARALTTTALRLAVSPDIRILAALASARSAETTRATALANEASALLPRSTVFRAYWLPAIRASISLARKDAAAAIESLRPASEYELGLVLPEPQMGAMLYPVYLRGEALLQSGRPAQAAAEFQKIIDHRGIVLNFVLGPLAHLQLGRARTNSGDRRGARAAYDRFFALWQHPDPDLPILKDARREYARLP